MQCGEGSPRCSATSQPVLVGHRSPRRVTLPRHFGAAERHTTPQLRASPRHSAAYGARTYVAHPPASAIATPLRKRRPNGQCDGVAFCSREPLSLIVSQVDKHPWSAGVLGLVGEPRDQVEV